MKAAYSYKRFSSAGQTDGDSLERQMQIARDWYNREIAQLGIPLDETFTDSGVSAFNGKHAGKKGDLGRFIARIKDGAVEPGSILIAENLDRISRQGPKIARKLIEQIVDCGVELHIANIGIKLTYGWENDWRRHPVDAELERAFKESERKSQLVGAALGKKKLLANWTTTAPFWIKKSNGGFAVIPEKVKLVKEIFRLASLGLGAKRIAQTLPKWDYCIMAITRTMRNRAVLGEHTVAGEPIMKFPQIIDQKAFDKVQTILDAKNALCSDGNKRPHTGARNSDAASNLFQGLMFDADGDRPLHYRGPDNQRHTPALISKFDAKRKSHRVSYDLFETKFLKWIANTDLDLKKIAEQKETPELGIARNKLNTTLTEIDKQQRLIARRTLDMENPDLPSPEVLLVSSIIVKAQQRLASLIDEKSRLESRISAEESKADALYHPEELLALVRPSGLKNNERRLRLRKEISRRILRIDCYFAPGVAVAHITFINGVDSKDCIVIGKDKVLFVWDKPPIDKTVEWLKAKLGC